MTQFGFGRRLPLLASAALAALTIAAPAHAQDQAGTETAPPDGQARLDDGNSIIVTAQRRAQTLIEVPQSVSVVGGDTLERQEATSFQDYAALVPGLNITQENPGESRVILRGINTGSVGSTVSVYIDETPFGSSGSLSNGGILAGDFDTFDVARIEVLRGPQGTLYGANSLGGTIKFVTVAPRLGEFELRGQAGVEFVRGGDAGWLGNAVVNIPLGDTLAFRASAFYRDNPGYIDAAGRNARDVNGNTSYGGRASLLFQPSDRLSIRLLALAQNIRTDSPSVYTADPQSFAPVDPLTGLAIDAPAHFERIAEANNVDYRLYSGTLNWDLGFASLTSATSYGTLDQHKFNDVSNTNIRDLAELFYAPTAPGTIGLAFQNDITTDKFTQEIRLASPDESRLEWLVGAYYTHEKSGLFQLTLPFSLATEQVLSPEITLAPGVTIPQLILGTLDSKYEEIAGFASLTWHVSSRFDITAGGRYSHNSQNSVQFSSQLGTESTIVGDSSQGVFTWSVAPRLELNDRVSLYARVAKGYRPGGPNAVPPNPPAGFPTSFEADTLVSYEIGVRGETVDHSFGFDASVFHLDWNNILITTVFIDPDTGIAFGLNGNGRGARSNGAEVTATLRPARGLTAILNIAYTDAQLLDDTTPEDGAINLTGGLAGDRLPYTPKWAGNLSVDYDWAMGGTRAYVGANLHLAGDQPAAFSADYRAAFGHTLMLDGYATLDLRAGVDFDRFSISAYIRNLTDSGGLVSATYPYTVTPGVGGANIPLALVSSIRPRTIGVTLGARF
jgi:outer membrane receptor protein involved in Fe transport